MPGRSSMCMDESVGAGGLIWKDDGIRRAVTRRRFNEPSSRGNTVKMMGTDVFITSPVQAQIIKTQIIQTLQAGIQLTNKDKFKECIVNITKLVFQSLQFSVDIFICLFSVDANFICRLRSIQ